jgi:hypothetical protein
MVPELSSQLEYARRKCGVVVISEYARGEALKALAD